MLTEKTFHTDTVSINYVEGPPSGMPLVMLHGVTTRWQTFLPVLPGFLVRYHTYALDLRGHGRSGRTPGAYLISNDAADVVAFLRDRVTEPAILLGWSLGAMTAIVVAAEAPELVRAVVLVDPPLSVFTDDDSSQAGFYEHFRKLRDVMTTDGTANDKRSALATLNPEWNDVQLRKGFKQLSQCDPEGLTLIIEKRKFEHYRVERLLPKITSPVLLIQGNPTLGAALDDQTAQVAVSQLADCAYVHLQDVGHGIHAERPAAFLRIVSDFLESL